jgi:predicted GIY-YIG superfamily endonuclease
LTQITEIDISGRIVCHNIPEESGVYLVTDKSGSVLYVGSTNRLRRRIAYLEAHVYDSSSGKYTHDASEPLIKLQSDGEEIIVHYLVCENYKEKKKQLKQKYNPPWNKR